MEKKTKPKRQPNVDKADQPDRPTRLPDERAPELGGRKSGLEPTRYGDWEKNGRCIDF